jgi:hypothetical protein
LPIAVAVVSTLNVRFLVNGASNYADKPQVVAADGRAAANQRSDRLLTQQSHEVILVMRKHSVADHIATKIICRRVSKPRGACRQISSMHQSEVSMKYACLVYFERGALDRFTPEEGAKLTEDSMAYDRFLESRGNLIMAQALEAPQTAVTIRVRNGKLSSTDGPFAETREILAGLVLIEARDLNEAIGLAEKIPLAAIGSIEIRPVMHMRAVD